MDGSLGAFSVILLAIPGIALRIAVRAVYGRRVAVMRDPLEAALSLASTLLIVLAVLGAIIGLIGVWWVLIVLGVMMLVALLTVADRLRRAEHRALLWSLSVAAQKGIPLNESARAFADETLGNTGVRATRLAQALEQGQSLGQATRVARLRMPPPMRLAVTLGESLGMLGPAMKQQLDDSQQADTALREAVVRFLYLGCVLWFFAAAIGFMMVKIVPVFERMFLEFELELPTPTLLVVNLSKFFVNYGWPAGIPFVLITPLLIVGAFLYFGGWLPRDLPLVWRMFRRYDGAHVLRGLALAVRRGLPLTQALETVADSYPIGRIARLVRRVAREVADGLNWTECLKRARLISAAEAAVLASAERAGNLPWALEEMADSALRRQTYRVQVATQLIFPPALVAVGMIVALFAVGLFIPIVALVQGLS
jgi:type II secretory pathway component PulF